MPSKVSSENSAAAVTPPLRVATEVARVLLKHCLAEGTAEPEIITVLKIVLTLTSTQSCGRENAAAAQAKHK